MDQLSCGLLLGMLIASAVSVPPPSPATQERKLTRRLRSSKLTGSVTEAVIEKVTGELFDFVKTTFVKKLQTLTASALGVLMAAVTDSTDRLIVIGVFMCLLALIGIALCIKADISDMRNFLLKPKRGRKKA